MPAYHGFVKSHITDIRDKLTSNGKTEGRLRRLETLDPKTASTVPGQYRLGWLTTLIDRDRDARREIRTLERELDLLLDAHGTTLHEEPGIGPIAAATLLCEVGDPYRFSRESKFARWSGTGAVAISSGEGSGQPVRHRLDFRGNRRINSVIYIASVTQQRDTEIARTYIDRKISEGKNPARSETRSQTTTRQPHHPPHVKRRKSSPKPTPPTSRLTRERPTDPSDSASASLPKKVGHFSKAPSVFAVDLRTQVQRSARTSCLRASCSRPCWLVAETGERGHLVTSLAMIPPSLRTIFAAESPHWRFS